MRLSVLLEDDDNDDFSLDYCWHKSRMLEEMAKKIRRGQADNYIKEWLLENTMLLKSKEIREIKNDNKRMIRTKALDLLDWIFRREWWKGCYKEKDGFWAVVRDNWGFHELEDFYKKIRRLPDDHDDDDDD